MYVVVVNRKRTKKKEMIEKIKEMILDSFFGEEWEQKLDFCKICSNAKWSYHCQKRKKGVNHFTEVEVHEILNLAIDMERLEKEGIDFLIGRKVFLEKLKEEKDVSIDIRQDVERFFHCIKNEIIVEVYEKVTEYEAAEWIFTQQNFWDLIAAFAWIKVCIEQKIRAEQFLPALHRIFPNGTWDRKKVEDLLQNVDSFEQLLGELWREEADVFDKVCCLGEQGVDVSMLGRRLVENRIWGQFSCENKKN